MSVIAYCARCGSLYEDAVRYLIKYVDNMMASNPVLLEQEFPLSFDAAWDRANDYMPALRTRHGRHADYVIEDILGTQITSGPERYGDA